MEVNDGWKGELDGVASFVVSVLGQKCERNELFFAVSNYARSEELAWSEPGLLPSILGFFVRLECCQ